MAVAGKLKVVSNYQALSDPPEAKPLQLLCYPFGSTAEGTPEDYPYPPPPPPPPMAPPPPVAMESAQAIMVTGARAGAPAMFALQEDLADLKLYRVPEPVDVAAKSQKQVAFLDRENVTGRLLYTSECTPWTGDGVARSASILLATVNDEKHGLGVALPTGSLTVFEASPRGDQLVATKTLRDYASGQDVEIGLGQSSQVFARCAVLDPDYADGPGARVQMQVALTNANPSPATVRIVLGGAGAGKIGGLKGVRAKDGAQIVELTVPANGTRDLRWTYTD
jgi:hypothetical protein